MGCFGTKLLGFKFYLCLLYAESSEVLEISTIGRSCTPETLPTSQRHASKNREALTRNKTIWGSGKGSAVCFSNMHERCIQQLPLLRAAKSQTVYLKQRGCIWSMVRKVSEPGTVKNALSRTAKVRPAYSPQVFPTSQGGGNSFISSCI